MYEFDEFVHLEATEDPTVFKGNINDKWNVGYFPNGGLMSSMLLYACKRVLPESYPHPLAFTSHFLNRAQIGPCTVRVTVMNKGKKNATASAKLEQHISSTFQTILQIFAIFGDLEKHRDNATGWNYQAPSSILPIESKHQNTFTTLLEVDNISQFQRLTVSVKKRDLNGAGFYFRFRDHRPIDVFALCAASDMFYPPALTHLTPIPFLTSPEGVTNEEKKKNTDEKTDTKRFNVFLPTLLLDVYVHNLPIPRMDDEVYVEKAVEASYGGHIEERTKIWSRDGRLLISARQLQDVIPWKAKISKL